MRTEDDQWAITASVGVTALGVASGRAMETHRDDGLVADPYAASFVEAASHEVDLPSRPTDDESWSPQSTYIGVRSRFFDDVLAEASARGVRQVVLLAAGLDTRAQRLDWPAGTTVFEIDQHGVLDFKDHVLSENTGTEAGGGARRVEVRVDLREDWPAALRDAGFDPSVPTAWLAEGLLPYLPARTEADLFTRVGALSAPGSRIGVEHFSQSLDAITDDETFATMSARFGIDVKDLFFDEPRADPVDRLRDAGWQVGVAKAVDLAERYGRPLENSMVEVFGATLMLDAALPVAR